MPIPEQCTGVPPTCADSDAELVFGTPPPGAKRRLQLPICLPQITGGYGAPFARGYNPQLAEYGLEQDDFLNFLDALNIAMVRANDVFAESRRLISYITFLGPKLSTVRYWHSGSDHGMFVSGCTGHCEYHS
jgi:hypothetical protein